jgi:hypothetical protein
MRRGWLLACVALAGCAAPPVVAPFVEGASTTHVLFVDLDGAAFQGGSDDATTDHSSLALMAPSSVAYVPPFDPTVVAPGLPASDVADVLIDRIRTLFAPWNVQVVRTRPSSGAYTLVAVGGDTSVIGTNDGIAGLAPAVDCTDAIPSNVVYDFSDEQSPGFGGVVSVAATAAHEAGHAFGLEHTTDTKDLMYAVASPTQTLPDVFAASFRETGGYSSFGAGGLSQPESCGRADPVNAGVLEANVGASTRADTTKPTLTVTMPAAGMDVSASADVEASATDDVGVVRIEVYKNFALVAIAQGGSISTTVTAADGETWYLTVEAIDAAANRASVTRLVSAHEPVDMTPPPDGAAPVDAGADMAPLPMPDHGCDYGSGGGWSPAAWLLTGLLLAARYRRARRAKRC